MSVLEVKNLSVTFQQDGRLIEAVKRVSFSVNKGETVALVGESGSGKSVTALSTVGLLGDNATVSGSVTYGGTQMVGASERALAQVRGNDISFIFQEPMTSPEPAAHHRKAARRKPCPAPGPARRRRPRPHHRASEQGRHP